MRVAVVDIGTNSTRLLVADVGEDGHLEELERRSIVTRLGQDVDATGALAEEAMGRVFGVLARYREAIDAHGAARNVAVLTSAVRDAANGERFTHAVREDFGLDARTIDGDEEARLTFRGATSERDGDDGAPVVVIDIGGGSTEFVAGHRGQVLFHATTQAGVVRQSERHLHCDPPTAAELRALRDEVRGIFADAVAADQRAVPATGIAVAGTATSLASIDQKLEPYDASRVHGYRLSRRRCVELLGKLAALTDEQRRAVVGLNPARAPTIVAGAAFLVEAIDLFGLDSTEVSDHDILRGAALELVHRNA